MNDGLEQLETTGSNSYLGIPLLVCDTQKSLANAGVELTCKR